MSHIIFETSRLIGRKLTPDDTDALYSVYGDAEAMRWVDDGQPLPREECARWIDVTHNNYAKRGYGMSALVLRETDMVIGFCGIVHPGGQPQAEIKYALSRPFWGRGFATEAVRAMLVYGAQTFHLTSIIATIAPENIASHRVLTKSGMLFTENRRNEDDTTTSVFTWQPGTANEQ
ncbi:MAG: GNAT family N-acetyltransferase [Akkermansiaceae bacterium]|nr:GNAT family N-acetyltransferase [Armatimonadota bacterium]